MQANPINFTDPSGQWCVAGFSVGPGRDCTQEETQRWAKFYVNQTFLLAKLMNYKNDSDGEQIAMGFAYEYLDTVLVLPFMSAFFEVADRLNDCGSNSVNYYKGVLYNIQNGNNQWVNAGRYLARAVLVGQAFAEIGAGIGGMTGGINITVDSLGFLSEIGIPITAMSAALVSHGALVLGAVAVRERVLPLRPLNFAPMSTWSGGGSDPRPPGFTSKWKKEGNYWVDPKTGFRWHYHPEDASHWAHWDVLIPGKGKIRIPVDAAKGVFKPR